ncbi:MAG: PD40 domain-containing protein [Bacteroidetes bacterium]|nr:PD40 domain-containing protein [Bacteroidota bacterium]
MILLKRAFVFLALFMIVGFASLAQEQDKEQSKLYMDQANEIMAATRAMDDARDIMIMGADFDTTNVLANFEAGHMQIETINRDRAVKYFLRVYRQNPNYRFDLEFWIAKSYHYGLAFDKAIDFYSRYKNKLTKKPDYGGKDKIDMKEVDLSISQCKNGKEFLADPQPFAITNIGGRINSEFEDYGPVLNADETEIIFTTRRRDGNTYENVGDDNKPYEDVFISDKSGSQWSGAKNIGPPVNTNYNESNLALSPDGQKLFIYRDENGGDIFESTKNGNGTWSEPTPLPGIINSSFRESSVTVTADGNTLYFASDRPGGFGGSDIYVCTKDSKGEWSRVKNLGTVINTNLDEDGPFISFDTKTLYFSSEGHKGMGGFDIFKTTLINADKNEWSEPENMGYPINSPDNDAFFTSSKDGKRWYYSTVREDGMGYDDIYIITAVDEVKKPEVAVKEPVKEEPVKEEVKQPVKEEPVKVAVQEPVKEEPKKEPVKVEPKKPILPIKYVVTVIDASTKQPLDAKVRMQGAKDKVVVGSVERSEGVTEFAIKSTLSKEYRISVERDGYIFQNIKAKIAGATTDEKSIAKTIEMRKIVVGEVSILRNIYFDFSKATFRTESYNELNKLEAMMKQNQNLKVEISGHTDFVGSAKFNKSLSKRRADAVRSFLTSKGVDPRRVKAVGYGEEKPIASNDDEREGRELNRRVEFKVLGN